MAVNGKGRSVYDQRTVAPVGQQRSSELDDILSDLLRDNPAEEQAVRERTLAKSWGTKEREFSAPQGCVTTQGDGSQTVLTWQTSRDGPRKCVTVSKETIKRPTSGAFTQQQGAFSAPTRSTDERSLLDVVDGRRFPGPPSYKESRTLQTHTETKTQERMLSPVFRSPVNTDRSPRVAPVPPNRRRVLSPEITSEGTVRSDYPSTQGVPLHQKRSVTSYRNYASDSEEALTWLEEQRRKLELKRSGRTLNHRQQLDHIINDRSRSSTDFTRGGAATYPSRPSYPHSDVDDLTTKSRTQLLKNSLSVDSLNGKFRAHPRTADLPRFTRDYGDASRFRSLEGSNRRSDDDRFYRVSSIQRPSSATPLTKYSFTMPAVTYDEYGRRARPGVSAPTSPVIPSRGASSRDAVVRSKGRANEWIGAAENATFSRLDEAEQLLRKSSGVHLTAPLKPVPTEMELISLQPIGPGVRDLEPDGTIDGTLNFRRSTPTLNRSDYAQRSQELRSQSSLGRSTQLASPATQRRDLTYSTLPSNTAHTSAFGDPAVFAPLPQRPMTSLGGPSPSGGHSGSYQSQRRIQSSETMHGSLTGSGQPAFDVRQTGQVWSSTGQQATNQKMANQQWLQQKPLSQQQQFSQQEIQYRQQVQQQQQQQQQLQRQQEQHQLLLQEQQRVLQLQKEEQQRLLQLQEQHKQLQLQEQQRQLQLQEQQRQLQQQQEEERRFQLQEQQRLLQQQQEQQRQLQLQEQQRLLQQQQEQQRQLQLQEQQLQLKLQEQQKQLELQEQQRLLQQQQEQQRQLQLQEQQRQLEQQQEQQRQLQLKEQQMQLEQQQEQQKLLQLQEQQRQLKLQEQQMQLQVQEQQIQLQKQQEQQKQLQLQEQQMQLQLKEQQQRQLQQQQYHSQTIQRTYVVEHKTEPRHPFASQTLDSRVKETSFLSPQPVTQFASEETFRETSLVEPHRSTRSDVTVQADSSRFIEQGSGNASSQYSSVQRGVQGGSGAQAVDVHGVGLGQSGVQVGVNPVGVQSTGGQVGFNQVGVQSSAGQVGLAQIGAQSTGGQVGFNQVGVQSTGRQAGFNQVQSGGGQVGLTQIGVQPSGVPVGLSQVIERRYVVEREVIRKGHGGQQVGLRLSSGQGDVASAGGQTTTQGVGAAGQGSYQAAYQGGTLTGTQGDAYQAGTIEKNTWVHGTTGNMEAQNSGTTFQQQGVRFVGDEMGGGGEGRVLPITVEAERVGTVSVEMGGQNQQQHQHQESYAFGFQQVGDQRSDGTEWTQRGGVAGGGGGGGVNEGRSESFSHQGIGSIHPGGSWTLRPEVTRSGGHQRNASESFVDRQVSPRVGLGRARTTSATCITDGTEWTHHQSPRFVRDTSRHWHKPNITRDDAINLLLDKEPGSFVVRNSSTFPGSFGLALKVSQVPPNMQTKGGDPQVDLIRHFLIEPTPKGVRLKGCSNEPVFASLSALIYQHSVTPLSLPCKLRLPNEDIDTLDNSAALSGSDSNGAACTVLYMSGVETENLTGPEALARSIKELFESGRPLPRSTIVQLKVTRDGITLTDNRRRIFFRRFYPIQTITFCGVDPRDRRWTVKSEDITISGKAFGFVARKPGVVRENACHVFLELDTTQPASIIVNFVTKVLIGQGQRLLQ